jgi:hypothetical protein
MAAVRRADAHDVHDSLEIVGEYVQRHFGAHILQRLHKKVGRPHRHLDGAERVLDCLTTLPHFLRMGIKGRLDLLKKMLKLPARDTAFLARRATILVGPREVPVAVVDRVQAELGLAKTNFEPSIATAASVKRPSWRHNETNRAQTLRMARPLSLRKSAIVL